MAHLCAFCVRLCGSLRTVVRFHAGYFALLVSEIVHSRVILCAGMEPRASRLSFFLLRNESIMFGEQTLLFCAQMCVHCGRSTWRIDVRFHV